MVNAKSMCSREEIRWTFCIHGIQADQFMANVILQGASFFMERNDNQEIHAQPSWRSKIDWAHEEVSPGRSSLQGFSAQHLCLWAMQSLGLSQSRPSNYGTLLFLCKVPSSTGDKKTFCTLNLVIPMPVHSSMCNIVFQGKFQQASLDPAEVALCSMDVHITRWAAPLTVA